MFTLEYKKRKYKFIAYSIGGAVLLLILIISAVTGGLKEQCSDNTSSTATTNLTSKSTEENAKNIYAHWKKKYGTTPQAAAGILGTMQLESQLNPKSVNPSSGATGLAQWLGDRLTSLQALANKQNKDVTNLGLQLDYLDQELNGSYSSSKTIFKDTSVHGAAKDWLMIFEGMSKNPEQWYLPQRYAYADHWYSVLGASDPVSSESIDTASQGEVDELACSSDSSSEASDSGVVKAAESMKGWFYYVQSHPSSDLGSDLKHPSKSGGTDCSGFVWLALNKAGYNVPANMGWYTMTMAQDAKGSHKYLKEVKSSDAKAGDVVIVNVGSGVSNNGHTAILLEDWKGRSTKIIEQGGGGDKVNESTVANAFYPALEGGEMVLARPIKK